MDNATIASRMRKLIGGHYRHQGREWILHEILEQEEVLVLVSADNSTPILADQYGHPGQRAPETHTLPLYGESGESLSEELLELLENRC